MAKKKTATRKNAAKKPGKHNGTTKAQAIRDTAEALGKKARPKDIIAALAETGITVTSPQVSSTLKAAGLRRGRRRRKAAVTVAKASENSHIHKVNLDELLQVKKLADQLGGTAKLKELAGALERLM